MIIRDKRGTVIDENATVAEISIASDSMLIDGGAPRFLADKRNHQIVMAGNKFIIPFRRRRFRL
jgi:hypothetical protein